MHPWPVVKASVPAPSMVDVVGVIVTVPTPRFCTQKKNGLPNLLTVNDAFGSVAPIADALLCETRHP
jgi:hypothetical protein